MPFPNDFFTVADDATATGRRVHFDPASMTANVNGVRVDPTEWNRNDGFSPGSMIVTYVPGLDLARSGAAPITDIGASLQPGPADRAARRRRPASAGRSSPSSTRRPTRRDQRALIIRPAKNLIEGHRYVVALRDLRDAGGAHDRGRSRLPALPRPHPDVHAGDRGAPSAPRARLRRARPRRRRPRRPVPRVGLHRRERARTSPAACCTSATTRSRRSAAASRVHGHRGRGRTSTTGSTAGSPARSPSRTT